MLEDLLGVGKTFLRVLVKVVLGMIVVPLGIFVSEVKPGWEEANTTVKVVTGTLLAPVVVFLMVAAPWWEDFEIEG